jgi:hypothetical protein
MRRLVLFALFAALAAPAAALSAERAADDGTLSVVNADGVVNVVARGGVIGNCDQCRVWITDPVSGDGTGPVVTGWEDMDPVTDIKSKWSGKDVRFKLIGGFFRLRVVGSGITLYAVGQGSGSIKGALTNTGTWALNDQTPRQLPDTIKPFQLTS